MRYKNKEPQRIDVSRFLELEEELGLFLKITLSHADFVPQNSNFLLTGCRPDTILHIAGAGQRYEGRLRQPTADTASFNFADLSSADRRSVAGVTPHLM